MNWIRNRRREGVANRIQMLLIERHQRGMTRHQASNHKQRATCSAPTPPSLVIGAWSLVIVCYLELVICDLPASTASPSSAAVSTVRVIGPRRHVGIDQHVDRLFPSRNFLVRWRT